MKRYIFSHVDFFYTNPYFDIKVIETASEVECPIGYKLFTITKLDA